MPPVLPDPRTAARAAARAHLASLFPDHGLTPDVAEGIADAVRVVVLREVEQAIRVEVGSPLASALFSNGVEFAADLVHNLAATAPRLRDLPPGEFGDLVRKITPTSQEN